VSITIYIIVIAVCVLCFVPNLVFPEDECTKIYKVKNGGFGCLCVARKFDVLKDSITYVTNV